MIHTTNIYTMAEYARQIGRPRQAVWFHAKRHIRQGQLSEPFPIDDMNGKTRQVVAVQSGSKWLLKEVTPQAKTNNLNQ